MTLPTYLLLQANDPPGTPRRFVMVSTVVERIAERDSLDYTQFSILENPLEVIKGIAFLVEWKTDAIEETPFHLRVVRKSRRYSGNRYYEVLMKKTSEYIKTRVGPINLYTMTQKHTVLPSIMLRVTRGKDTQKRWHFLQSQIPPVIRRAPSSPLPSAPPSVSFPIPRHVLEGYIDSQIAQRQSCPITLEPYTRETVAYVTCGHLFDKVAIRRELERSGQCPQCRTRLGREDIQTLS